MKPHLTTSASPARWSRSGSVASAVRSQSTPAGGWKAPTRFLPAAVSIAVLPPTAASTMPSRVVGQVHHPDAAQPGGGDPAGEVGGGAAAEADDRVGPGEAGGAERLPAVAGDRERLGRLAVRDRQRQHGQPGRAQPVGDRGGAVPQGRRVHQRDLGRPGQQRRQLAVQVAADHDVVPARPPGSAADRHPHRIPADTGRPRSGRRPIRWPGGRRRRRPRTGHGRSAVGRSAVGRSAVGRSAAVATAAGPPAGGPAGGRMARAARTASATCSGVSESVSTVAAATSR